MEAPVKASTKTSVKVSAIPPGEGTPLPSEEPLFPGVRCLLRQLGRDLDEHTLRYGAPLDGGRLDPRHLPDVLARFEIAAVLRETPLSQMSEVLLPCLLLLEEDQSLVLLEVERAADGDSAFHLLCPLTGGELRKTSAELARCYSGTALFAHSRPREQRRLGGYAAEEDGHWFWGRVRAQWKHFAEVALASLFAAMLAVATALFAMQVYDRVVPTEAEETLWALAIGVLLAIVLEFLLRGLRAQLIESSGKRLDLGLSRQLFEQAVSLKLAARPRSAGAFSSQMRDFDSVREFFTASTLGACGDVPFSLLFVALIALIGGPVAFVPLAAMVLIVVPSLLVQPVVARRAREGMQEAAMKNAVLLEAVDHLETVKACRGEGRSLRLWQQLSAEQAGRAVAGRHLDAWLAGWAVSAQQMAYIGTVITGVYLIFNGDMTIGALIACSILTSRSLAPVMMVGRLLARWQQVKVALEGLEDLMQRPVERPADRQRVTLSHCHGDYHLDGVQWRYDAESPPVVNLAQWRIDSGQRWALLGNNGSGKSTLLRLLAGLYDPAAGSLRLDGLEMSQIEPGDVRRQVSYMPQDIALMHGTLRDNLTLDGEARGERQLLEALDWAGLGDFVRGHPLGLDMHLAGGNSLSGGQRQAVGLARLFLQDAPVVLMDEPTAALDQATESAVIGHLEDWLARRTVVVATHKRSVLRLATHALVLKGGRLLLSGSVEEVDRRLREAGTAGQEG